MLVSIDCSQAGIQYIGIRVDVFDFFTSLSTRDKTNILDYVLDWFYYSRDLTSEEKYQIAALWGLPEKHIPKATD